MLDPTLPMKIAIGSAIAILIFLWWKFREDTRKEIYLAMLISFLWVTLSGVYSYKTYNLSIFGLNLFPFTLWTLALVLFKELSEVIEKFVDDWKLYVILVLIWIPLMLIIEYIGYNLLGIQLGNGDSGLFGFDVLHLQYWGQIYYLFAGVVFIGIARGLNIK